MIKIEYVDPAELNAAPYNPRQIDPDALQRLATLIDSHGFVDPIIARREDKMVIGGHQRLKAIEKCVTLHKTVPVVYLDGISDIKAKALNVALNNQSASGTWDHPKLNELLTEIDTGEFDIPKLTGFSEVEIGQMLCIGDEFQPTDQEPPRLDEKKPVKCPECGHEFQA